jgi:hypothetical protein
VKVLHINDLAGVAGCLVKYLRKAGHEADCISFMDDHEFGFSEFYKYRHFNNQLICRAFVKDALEKYDIIHVHFSFPLLPWLYENTDKPIVMHYHGTELVQDTMLARVLDHLCKLILVAGPAMLPLHSRAELCPTIIDMDHFHPMPELREKGLFTFVNPYAKAMAFEGAEVEIIDRHLHPTRYADLPKLLNQYSGYIDVRVHKTRGLLADFSKTGLEALACGLKVYHGEAWHTELPEMHRPEVVVQRLLGYYEEILS